MVSKTLASVPSQRIDRRDINSNAFEKTSRRTCTNEIAGVVTRAAKGLGGADL